MDEVFRYRGRSLSREDIAGLRDLIAQHPRASRRRLSALVCEAWDWRQGNGALCDMVCRSLMLALHRAGHIELPAKKFSPLNSLAKRRKPATDFELDQSPIECGFKALSSLTIRQVRRTEAEPLFNGLIERFHYLGYTQSVGEHLKQIVFAGDRPVPLLSELYCPVPGYWQSHPLCPDIEAIARGSFKHKEPPAIKGSGYVVNSLEAALWAFAKGHDFKEGALLAVNLGDDADTTGAVYGQIAGAFYGYVDIPKKRRDIVAESALILRLADALADSN